MPVDLTWAGLCLCCAVIGLVAVANPRHRLPRLIGAIVAAGLLVRYLAWRVTDTMPPPSLDVESILAWAFLIIELLSAGSALLTFHVLSRTTHRSAEADAHPVEGHPGGPPSIDILIPTYNEDARILRRTIIGALAQDYPDFRVWVCDDKRRPWLAELAAELGAGYLTRADNLHAKAGNMNAAVAQLLAGPRPPTAVAIMDADFVATPQFLRRAAALLHDSAVAVVQTPQVFFNPDPIQLNLGGTGLVPDEQRFFFDVIMPSKDAHGTAFSCGTSGIVRLAALQAVGGFPTESVTEDMLLSVKLYCLGWKTVYLDEPLTAGLAPEGLSEYVSQRGRWCLGVMQIMRTRWSPWSWRPVPLLVRLHTIDSFLFWVIAPFARLSVLLAPLLYWWFGLAVMRVDVEGAMAYAVPYLVATVAFTAWVSRGTVVPLLNEALGLLILREMMLASWHGLFGNRNQPFEVTTKGSTRGGYVLHWPKLNFFLLVAAATVGGMVWRLYLGPAEAVEPSLEAMTLFWSGYNLIVLTLAGLICIEFPRRRGEERFRCDEPVLLMAGDRVWAARMSDLSVLGCSARPDAAADGDWAVEGMRLSIYVSEAGFVPARLVRLAAGSVHLAFEADRATQDRLIRKVFSGGYLRYVQASRLRSLLAVTWRRAFG